MAFDSRRRNNSPSPARSSAPSGGSLNSRFSAIAAQRVNSPRLSSSSTASRPQREVRGAVQKAGGQRRRSHHRNDRRMEIDSVGSGSGNDSNRNRNSRNRNQDRNRRPATTNNNNNKKNNRPGRREEKKPINQSDLDKELEAYMMKNSATAQATLDMDIDSYMASAPSKN